MKIEILTSHKDMPATFSGTLTMSVIKRGTSQDTTWCDRFKRAQVSYKDRI